MGCLGTFRYQLLALYHDSYIGGHLGVQATYARLKRHFIWPGMFKAILDWIKSCDIYARCKHEHCASLGLLQPLSVPSQV